MKYHRLWLAASCICMMVSLQATEPRIGTIVQDTIRPSFPFPEFLSTGPYIWYKDVDKKPIKGHTYRLATFTEDGEYKVFLEKVIFGDRGCCLEIVDYRQLDLNQETLRSLFPQNNGRHDFKLVRWDSSLSFTFDAFGGRYQLTEINTDSPRIAEVSSK